MCRASPTTIRDSNAFASRSASARALLSAAAAPAAATPPLS
eukprot:CAMPEP_0170180660 /NCGR_PEP_ID=MMETSP0040_2-20121228/22592_1 /TAXON_ID=641309 /ORGANISM="Lotharella oceanica, Strain CCMP622" /LENGTH=40 /DNA_ID= /DNA_START= /DNA_END= /DNA_ORIENTATION=